MILYRKPPETIIIHTKVINGNKVYVWSGKPYVSEYLARKAAQLAAKTLEKSIKRTYV